jgi:hypothetical protein
VIPGGWLETHIVVVESGTVIEDKRTGEKATVTDTCAVSKCGSIYVTEPVWEALKIRARPLQRT